MTEYNYEEMQYSDLPITNHEFHRKLWDEAQLAKEEKKKALVAEVIAAQPLPVKSEVKNEVKVDKK